MAGQVLGGQTLTPNRNVTAPAGTGGNLWGANGGGITPIGGNVTGQWSSPVAQTLADGETATTYITAALPNASAVQQEAIGVLLGRTSDKSLPSGNSNMG